MPTQTIIEAAKELNGDDVDGLFLSCTALNTAGLIKPLEQRFGKPVLTSNQCLLWQSLRLAGDRTPINGYGRLFDN